ncbi:hypothetical protein, partial [Streptosporangium sp. NPDC003464]
GCVGGFRVAFLYAPAGTPVAATGRWAAAPGKTASEQTTQTTAAAGSVADTPVFRGHGCRFSVAGAHTQTRDGPMHPDELASPISPLHE